MPQADPGSRCAVSAAGGRVRALFEGHEVADSDRALACVEPGETPRFYFPRDDVQMSVLRRNDHVTASPWLGPAHWFTIMRDAKIVEDVAWSYETPFDDAAAIAGYISFDPEHVEIEAEGAAPVRRVPPMDPPYA